MEYISKKEVENTIRSLNKDSDIEEIKKVMLEILNNSESDLQDQIDELDKEVAELDEQYEYLRTEFEDLKDRTEKIETWIYKAANVRL